MRRYLPDVRPWQLMVALLLIASYAAVVFQSYGMHPLEGA